MQGAGEASVVAAGDPWLPFPMPDISIEALTGALALATFLLVFVTGALAVANWRAASAAQQSADAVVREFRLKRRPHLDITWSASRDLGQTPVWVKGFVRETAHVPTVIDAVRASANPVGAAECALEVRGYPEDIPGVILCGPETLFAFEMMFEATSEVSKGGILASLTVDVTASVEDIRDTRHYYLTVGVVSSIHLRVNVLSFALRPEQAPGEREHWSMADALQRAWRGGLGR